MIPDSVAALNRVAFDAVDKRRARMRQAVINCNNRACLEGVRCHSPFAIATESGRGLCVLKGKGAVRRCAIEQSTWYLVNAGKTHQQSRAEQNKPQGHEIKQ